MNKFVLWFTKITGIIPHYFYFKKKVYFEDKKSQSTKIKGGAIIICNHTHVYDFPVLMFTFFSRDLHVLAAEILFERSKIFKWFAKQIGAIKVDRSNYDFSFINKTSKLLKKKKVVLIFPESRLPTKDDPKGNLLDFKTSYIYLALENNVPIIPVCTNGQYGSRKSKDNPCKLIVGKKILLNDMYDSTLSEKENISKLNCLVKSRVEQLGNLLNEK